MTPIQILRTANKLHIAGVTLCKDADRLRVTHYVTLADQLTRLCEELKDIARALREGI